MALLVVGLSLASVGVLIVLIACLRRLSRLRKRFSAIISVEDEIARMRARAEQDVAQLRATAAQDSARLGHEAAQLRAAAEQEAARLQATATRQAAEIQQRVLLDTTRMQHEASQLRAVAEQEAIRLREASARELSTIQERAQRERDQQAKLTSETTRMQSDLARLGNELGKVEGGLEDISFGLYKPQYNFDTPERFKVEMDRVYEAQKTMIRTGKAASFRVSWTVGDSKREGERMQKQYCKLLLRAFNGECDAAIAKVTWNNATKMEERIRKAFDAINLLGEVMTVSLSAGYRKLKLAELHLEHELAEKKREIVEEQRRIRDQMRDEEKALQEAERARADADAEEARFQKALEKAKVELSKARGEEHGRLNDKILELQHQLEDARAKSVRAKSLAEMTKAGYVYIISNIGSFGEQVFKIGMTRRLEPMDRVRELGAASVPFPFDVHAMVYSDDAPALEAAFHQNFRDRSLNLVNLRKEFFRVDLNEIEAFAAQRGLSVAFTKLAEAREYRESVAMRLARGSGPTVMPPTNSQDRAAMASALKQFSSRSREHAAEPQ